MKKRLIVNADDLGLSNKTNEGILEAHLNGIVTSSTLMVTMPAVEHALTMIRDTDLDVGLHVDLSWGKAIATTTGTSSLVRGDGMLLGKKKLIRKLAMGRLAEADLVREISAQIKTFKATGLKLYHLDVHQHFHGFPVVMKALMKVGLRENIPFVRFVNEVSLMRPINAFIYCMFVYSRRYFHQSIGKTDRFLGLALTDNLNETTLSSQLVKIDPGLTELMCHPGYEDAALNGFSRLRSRELEVKALTSNRIKDTIAANGITLTTFRQEYLS